MSGLWAQLIELSTRWQRFSLYGLKIGEYCISSSSFSIQDKAASISLPDFLRIGQRIFWQSRSGFAQWPKVSRTAWKGREPSGVGRRVAGFKTSQGNIVRSGFSISTIWYLRILWSDIHKWPLPFKSCFTWWLVKIVSLPPKESFKASSIRIVITARFRRRGKISFQ